MSIANTIQTTGNTQLTVSESGKERELKGPERVAVLLLALLGAAVVQFVAMAG